MQLRYPTASEFCEVFWGLSIVCKLSLVGYGTEFVNIVQLYYKQGNNLISLFLYLETP